MFSYRFFSQPQPPPNTHAYTSVSILASWSQIPGWHQNHIFVACLEYFHWKYSPYYIKGTPNIAGNKNCNPLLRLCELLKCLLAIEIRPADNYYHWREVHLQSENRITNPGMARSEGCFIFHFTLLFLGGVLWSCCD